MSNEEEKKCPLCAEEMDWTDQQLNPCKCGYEVCVWCWHHIMDMAEKDATEGRCPACRTPYDKDRVVGLEANFERVAGNTSRKQKLSKSKSKSNEGRKDLSNVRVIQRKMAYIIGLPLDLADEELLQRKDYFGQYGKVTKVSLSRTAGGTVQQFINDTCSVYITYSTEEEAVTCIQSVHGYLLDGRLLRASFGTAKYCHAWLRNMPCSNPACLYLHTMGAEEDSFGKDEAAAVHTRNRVQEIVGGTQYLHRRSGSMLPPPVYEQLNIHNDSAEEPASKDGLKDVASVDHLPCSKDKDSPITSSKQTTTFVDIVGRSSNSSSNKDVNSVEDEWMLNMSSDTIHFDTETSNSVPLKSSTPMSKLYSEPFRETIDSNRDDTSVTKAKPLLTTKNHNDHSLWQTEYHNQTKSYADEDTIPAPDLGFNDGYNENKFQNSAKSDRIYRGSNSFSNEEIVEHLRRLDHDTVVNNDENSAALESSIISNILAMDLDGSGDSNSVYPQTVTGLFEARDGRHSSLRNYQNYDQSRFSFAKELGFSGQQIDLASPSSNIGQGLTFSGLQDSCDNKDDFYKPQHQVASRAQNLMPPGFSMPSNMPPPGFSACMRTEQAVAASSGNYFRIGPNHHHYRSPSLGNISNSSDDFMDHAALVGGGKSSTNGLTNSYNKSFSSASFDEELKHWIFKQQQQCGPATSTTIHHHHHHHHQPQQHHQEPQFSQTIMQQHHTPQFPSSQDDLFSGLVDRQHQSYNNPSLFTQQPNFAGGGYHHHHPHQEEPQQHDNRSEIERFGFDSLYGDYMFQMPTSGDVYTPRVFGM